MEILSDPALYKEKEALYIQARNAENRILSDDELKWLPYKSRKHQEEWNFRQRSMLRLLKHLSNKGEKLRILDVGCGNGWMSFQLYKNGYTVTGMDLNMEELQQAERVFGTHDRLQWVFGNVGDKGILQRQVYDIVLFAASCQYFPDMDILTNAVAPLLNTGGEIHLFDSVFYTRHELSSAQMRSHDYYNALGVPQMASYYFHHGTDQLKRLGYKKKYPPFYKKATLQWWVR